MFRLIFAVVLLCGVFARASGAIRAGLSLERFGYVEDIPGAGSSRETGFLPFFAFGGSLPLSSAVGAEASFRTTINSTTKYEGTDLANFKEIGADDTNTMHDLEIVGTWRATPDWMLYGGLSSRFWDRFLSYGSGYREIYRWTALPLGARYSVDDAWSVDVAILPVLQGTIDVVFSETVTNGDDTRLSLGSKTGFRAKLTSRAEIGGWTWFWGPWLEWSSFGASEARSNSTPTNTMGGTLGDIREPDSSTTRLGISAIVEFPL